MKARAAEAERVQQEALDWLRRLTSGQVTHADLDALDRWRAADPKHRRAIAEANLLWDVLGKVADEADASDRARVPPRVFAGRPMARRALVTGAVAAGAACLAVWPPAHLWPTLSELMAAYRTVTGERRQLAIASAITLQMDTQTSMTAPVTVDRRYSLELIAGQLAVSVQAAAQPVVIAAASGRSRADGANFNVRRDGSSVCVTCAEGAVQVSYQSSTTTLGPGEQVTYGGDGLGQVTVVNPTVVTAWQRGLLIFHDVALEQVIAEVNRYRPGRIILLNEVLRERKVMVGFRLDRIDDVVGYFTQAFNMRARSLPGGVVLLS
jgi:transmembrane sensor